MKYWPHLNVQLQLLYNASLLLIYGPEPSQRLQFLATSGLSLHQQMSSMLAHTWWLMSVSCGMCSFSSSRKTLLSNQSKATVTTFRLKYDSVCDCLLKMFLRQPHVSSTCFPSSLMCCYLAVVERLQYLHNPGSYTGRRHTAGRFNHAGQVSGKESDKRQHLVLQVEGWTYGHHHQYL